MVTGGLKASDVNQLVAKGDAVSLQNPAVVFFLLDQHTVPGAGRTFLDA